MGDRIIRDFRKYTANQLILLCIRSCPKDFPVKLVEFGINRLQIFIRLSAAEYHFRKS